jgi:hypothetical protein
MCTAAVVGSAAAAAEAASALPAAADAPLAERTARCVRGVEDGRALVGACGSNEAAASAMVAAWVECKPAA